MAVKRIVAIIKAPSPAKMKAFYRDLFELDIAMDRGWIVTLPPGLRCLEHAL